jgi:hypothetical protein
MPFRRSLYFSPEGATTTPPPAPAAPPTPPDPAGPPADGVSALVHRYRTAEAALAVVYDENMRYRARHNTDQQRITALEAKVPKDGDVVLTGDHLVAWQAVQELLATGVKPADLKATLGKIPQLEAENQAFRDQAVQNTAAELTGYNPLVLRDQLTLKKLHLEIKDVNTQVDGKTQVAKVPHVRPLADANAALEPLDVFMERELANTPYLAALKEGNKEQSTTSTTGVQMPTQNTGERGRQPNNPVRTVMDSTFVPPSKRNAQKTT